MAAADITVAGAGVIGLWQALTLARLGHQVRVVDQHSEPLSIGASSYAGAMLAPDCEAEAAPALVRDLGRDGLALWQRVFPGVINNGSLVVAAARDQPDLMRFAKMTRGHRLLQQREVGELEADLGDRFASALYFADEAHVVTPDALQNLREDAIAAGVDFHLGISLDDATPSGVLIDCRGMGARSQLPDLRGVRGERLLIRSRDVHLSRPVRLLHPRHPLYIVPWGDGRYLVGATMIESEDAGPITVRSALELLGAAYAVHPAFGEAEILEANAGVRPAFPDNVPRAMVHDDRRISVNGAYRHGFLLAPVLAQAVAGYLADGRPHPLIKSP
jgi:glycine oxidase